MRDKLLKDFVEVFIVLILFCIFLLLDSSSFIKRSLLGIPFFGYALFIYLILNKPLNKSLIYSYLFAITFCSLSSAPVGVYLVSLLIITIGVHVYKGFLKWNDLTFDLLILITTLPVFYTLNWLLGLAFTVNSVRFDWNIFIFSTLFTAILYPIIYLPLNYFKFLNRDADLNNRSINYR